ncbi:tRNA adenosine(34) deaminase TadA [Faecalispora anaeroviscerum]|uniref:tRNA adenosine(34) deaminase TadA n=1 Tax=Faecalispora anaeroviscerum TaxID=2991836 RepID=UPI0024B9A588|nr:tRNA adenosine(34) deaminase TadA [Faecalispora anaeroviscerum]
MTDLERDEKMMRRALELARQASLEGEVPVGAVIARGDEIIAEGRNRREACKNALCHAEIEAIDAACRALGGWRLWECDLYVTLEPCPMCTGAILNARIVRVVFGASDPKAGSCGSVVNLFDLPYNHHPQLVSGVLREECGTVLTDFFQQLREKRAVKKACAEEAPTEKRTE